MYIDSECMSMYMYECRYIHMYLLEAIFLELFLVKMSFGHCSGMVYTIFKHGDDWGMVYEIVDKPHETPIGWFPKP